MSLVKVKVFSMILFMFDIWYLITRQFCSSSQSASSVVILELFKGYLRKYEIKSPLLKDRCSCRRNFVLRSFGLHFNEIFFLIFLLSSLRVKIKRKGCFTSSQVRIQDEKIWTLAKRPIIYRVDTYMNFANSRIAKKSKAIHIK